MENGKVKQSLFPTEKVLQLSVETNFNLMRLEMLVFVLRFNRCTEVNLVLGSVVMEVKVV